VNPHKWAVGTTFEWEFDFPVTTNPAYEAKPAPKRKTRTSANPKAVSSRDRKTPKPATIQTASRNQSAERAGPVRTTGPIEPRETLYFNYPKPATGIQDRVSLL
jgi:hypothetical protein